MAIGQSDGSIILSTKVDTSGLNKGMSQMQGKATGLTKTFSKLAAAIASAFAIQKIIQFSNEAGQLATQTEASVQRLVDIYGSASDSVGDFIDQNARALGMSKAAAASFSSVYGNLFSVWADQATNAELTNRYLQMTAVVASKTGRTVQDVQERIRSGLLGNTEAIEDLGVFVNVKTIEMTDAFQRMADGKSWEQLDAYTQQQIRTMAILEQATQKYGTEVANTTALTRSKYQAAYEDFKNTWGQVVNLILIPVLNVATKILTVLTQGLTTIARLSGKTVDNTALQEQANSIGSAVDNQEALTDAMKETAKEQKKLLAGFDDLNILSSGSSDTSSSVGANGMGIGDLSLGESLGVGSGDQFETEISKLEAAGLMIAGAALVALGVILIAYGQIPLGIGAVVAGAGALGISAYALFDDVTPRVRAMISGVLALVSVALIAIGIILICTGVGVQLGIGLIVAGLAGIATDVAVNWDFLQPILKAVFDEIFDSILLSSGLVVLGILLIAVGVLPLGLGLLLSGVGSLGYQILTPHWDFIKDKVRAIWNSLVNIWNRDIKPGLTEVQDAWEELYNEHLEPVIEELWQDYLSPFLAWIEDVFTKSIVWAFEESFNRIEFVFETFGKVAGDFLIILANILGFITNVFEDDWEGAWGNVENIFKVHFNNIWEIAKSVINLIIDGVNTMIKGINKIKFDVPDWIPVIGAQKFEFGIPEIPQLARGAVIPPNREFLAVLGDNKKENEIVSPVSTMKQAFMEAMIEMGGQGQPTKEEHYYLDETELMSIMYRLVKGGERLNGNDLVEGGI